MRMSLLRPDVSGELARIAREGADEADLAKVKEYIAKAFPEWCRDNWMWLNVLLIRLLHHIPVPSRSVEIYEI